MTWHSQVAYDLRFEWGLEGARRLSSGVDVSIVVDVLSFSTCVDVATAKNGSTIAFSLRSPSVLCGCLRNASAVARKASSLGKRILVIAAGERWPDGGLRSALEDIIGAGAILSRLPGTKSPEAAWAVLSFEQTSTNLRQALRACSSGQELLERGFPEDVDDAAEFDVSTGAPILRDKYFSVEAET